jgi:glycosyltransferase involved in cell wall biosynthesis
MNVELSICIPTWNRVNLLEQSLNSLLPQCADRPVEVCVSDNASTDATAALLARYPNVKHRIQAENVGIDHNTLAVLRMATGKYVLPIGDDEIMLPYGISGILTALRAQPDMLILNGCHGVDPHLPAVLQNREITCLREAFRLLWDKMPLGGFITRRDYAAQCYTDRYLGTHHAYSGAAWDYLLDLRHVRIHCMSQPVIDFRKVKKSYAGIADIIHLRDIPRWFDLIPPYYADVVAPVKRHYLRTWRKPRALLRFGVIWLKRHA